MSKSPNHIHRYKKTDLARKKGVNPYIVYKCLEPTCTHYIPVHLAEGKMCMCSRCKEPMIITKHTLTSSNGGAMLYPHCGACTKSKKPDVNPLHEFLEKVVPSKA